MGTTPPATVPAVLVAGDSWNCTLEFPEYPIADGWTTLELRFRGVGKLDVDPARITDDGTTFTVLTDPADSATLGAGRYEWFAKVIGSGAVAGQEVTAAKGVVTLLANPETANAGDLQSDNEQMLALIRAELKARIPGNGSAHVSRSVDGFQLDKADLETLDTLERKYANRVYQERHAGRAGPDVAFVL